MEGSSHAPPALKKRAGAGPADLGTVLWESARPRQFQAFGAEQGVNVGAADIEGAGHSRATDLGLAAGQNVFNPNSEMEKESF